MLIDAFIVLVYKRKETGKNFFEATMLKTAELDICGKGSCQIDLKKNNNKKKKH